MLRLYRPPFFSRLLFPGAVCRIRDASDTVFLTFDDGPSQSATEKIIQLLKSENIEHAIFFCNAVNIYKYYEKYQMIIDSGFTVANHGYFHLDGWKTSNRVYLENIEKGFEATNSKLFRPPYGHISPWQYMRTRNRHKLILWDLLLYDFEKNCDATSILSLAEKKIRSGSVIILHDKEDTCTMEVLKGLIGLCHSRGFSFGNLLAHI